MLGVRIPLICCWAVLLAFGALGVPQAGEETPVGVHLHLAGPVLEQAREDDPFQLLMGQHVKPVGVRELVQRIASAAEAKQVRALYLTLDMPALSWGHALVIRKALQKFKDTGKPIIVHADFLLASHYLVASAADKLYLNPNGVVFLNGLSASQLYLKGTLDKLGLQAEMYHVGAYKGADEPLTQTGPSKEAEEMMNWLLDDLFAQLAEDLGRGRGKDAAAGKAWLEGGPYSANQALAAGLVDGLKSRLDALHEAKQAAGLKETERLDRRFGEKKAVTFDFSNPFSIFKLFGEIAAAGRDDAAQKPSVGVIYAEGLIVDGKAETGEIGSTTLVEELEKARKDAGVKAVVLRVVSPGGSASASDSIAAALARLKAEKPVVVSMGYVAASGGYYISAPADRIFAEPSSLVGSIGVVGGKVVTKGFQDWIGVSVKTYTRGGERAGFFNTTTPFTPEQKKWFQGTLDEIYGKFAAVVKTGRGAKLKDFDEKITGGRVFTGRQSLANGLVDELGALDDAIAWAADRAGLPKADRPVRVLNKPANIFEQMLKGLSGKDQDEGEVSSGTDISAPPADFRVWLAALGVLDPERAAAVRRQLTVVKMLQREGVLAWMPFEIEIKP